MPKKKKLFLVILLALIIDDICKYIRVFMYDKPKHMISFDFIRTRFDNSSVLNLSIVYILIVSVAYFASHFLDDTDYQL